MANQNIQFIAFNRGIVSRYGLQRIDIEKMRFMAEIQRNWMPRVLGSMMLRAGSGYQGFGTNSNAKSLMVPFIKATSDTAIIEVQAGTCRFLTDDGNGNLTPLTRVSVATTITNGNFTGNITGWTTADEAGASTTYVAPNQMGQVGTGLNAAVAYQQVSVAVGDENKVHGIRILINRSPVGLRIGTTLGADDLQEETYLGGGTHSLAITPGAASFYVYFFNRTIHQTTIAQCTIEAPGIVTVPNSWNSASLPLLRYDQSADVIYSCDGSVQLFKFERRNAAAWSLVFYGPTDGPFLPINFAPTTITGSATSGDITLTASSAIFNAKQAGGLFKLSSIGQSTDDTLGGLNQASNSIRVTGEGNARTFNLQVTGSGFSGRARLQIGQTDQGPWAMGAVLGLPFTDNINDGNDNQILYYRVIIDQYSAGTIEVEFSYAGGSQDGIVRLLTYNSPTSFVAIVLQKLGNTNGTSLWYEGAWSFYRGFPTCPVLHEDRLFWLGLGQYWGSITDEFESFDDTALGGSAPINRTLGKGPVDYFNWGLSLLRLLAGTDGIVVSARSDGIDTPLTPENFNLKYPITQGCARIAAVNADDQGFFVHRNLVRVYEMAFDTSNYIKLDYGATDLTQFCPEVCAPGIVRMAVQRVPDTRVYCVLSDGSVAVMVNEKTEQIVAWIKYDFSENGGFVEDCIVLPQPGLEDAVWLIVKRTINGSTVRYYEKLALESECVGGTLNKQADAFIIYSGAPTNSIGGLTHLIGQNVIVWGDGKDLSPGSALQGSVQKTYLVDNTGHITLDPAVTVSNAIIGLPYTATFKSAKMAYAAQMGSALTMKKRAPRMGLILSDAHSQGLFLSTDGSNWDSMPQVVKGATVPYDTVFPDLDDPFTSMPTTWTTDTRVWLSAVAPRPCRVLGTVVDMQTNEG